MSELIIDIQEDIELGVLSFRSIAKKYCVPISWVTTAWDSLCEQEQQNQTNDNWYDEQYELYDN